MALRVGDTEKGEILFRALLHRFDDEIVTLGIGQFLIETRRALTQRNFVFSRNGIEYVECLRMAFDTVFALFVGGYDRIAVADYDTLDGCAGNGGYDARNIVVRGCVLSRNVGERQTCSRQQKNKKSLHVVIGMLLNLVFADAQR